jgi:hypothetical protein
MILRRSRSVAPPQTPSFSRTTMACSRHDALTMQILQIDLASSAAASESGKKTAGSKPLQAPWFRHDRSAPDIEIPLDHGESPRTGQCMCQASHLQVRSHQGSCDPLRLRGEDQSEVLPGFHQTMRTPRGNSAGRTTLTLARMQIARSAFR